MPFLLHQMAYLRMNVGLAGDSHSRRLFRANASTPTRPNSFPIHTTPTHSGHKQAYITHLTHANNTPNNWPYPVDGSQANIHQIIEANQETNIFLISGGGNDLDSHECRPTSVGRAMVDLATMVFKNYGKIVFFIPIPPRTQFRKWEMSIESFYDGALDSNAYVAEHTGHLPYRPLIICNDKLMLDFDGVHYTELSYRTLGHRAGQHIRREMAALHPRITRPRTANLPPPQNPTPALPPPQNPSPALPSPSLPLASPASTPPTITIQQLIRLWSYALNLTGRNQQIRTRNTGGVRVTCRNCTFNTHYSHRIIEVAAAIYLIWQRR